jgi:GNAT superfamily N-acetyltransferase
MDSAYSIALEAEPKASDMNAIVKELLAFNNLHTGGGAPQYIVVTVRDREQALVGGLVGATYLGWLQVHALWVKEELRGRGYGDALLKVAEEEAIRRGCANSCLETLSFQALPFYEKRGYVIYGELPDFPAGEKKYSLAKPLLAKSERRAL